MPMHRERMIRRRRRFQCRRSAAIRQIETQVTPLPRDRRRSIRATARRFPLPMAIDVTVKGEYLTNIRSRINRIYSAGHGRQHHQNSPEKTSAAAQLENRIVIRDRCAQRSTDHAEAFVNGHVFRPIQATEQERYSWS